MDSENNYVDPFDFRAFVDYVHIWSEQQDFWKYDPQRNSHLLATIPPDQEVPASDVFKFYEVMCATYKMAKMALIVTESAEAIEDIRRGKFNTENFENELADIIIRTINFASHYQIDIISVMQRKMEINRERTILKEDGKQV